LIKKSYIFVIILILVFPLTWVHALSDTQKWAILDTFKQKQYDLLFESDLWDFSSEYSDIFNISKKVDIYESIWNKVEKEREEVQTKNDLLLEKISSLEESILQLDLDIENTLIKVDTINKNVIQIKKEIEVNEDTIWILKKKISENMDILLEYLIYIYKKWNTVYEDREIDNLKSILLNEEDISDIINDLYYKWIIQVAWKKLIDNHRKYISELYLKKVQLEKQEESLKKLRKMWIIEKKVLDDKKAFKERILEVSKWQQSYYQKYVYDKLEIEKNFQLKAFKEKVKFNSIRDSILKKYNCSFVDVSKNTAESRALSWKCLDINKMIYSESKLDWVKVDWYNFFDWPVEPDKWMSAYFHDSDYKKDFWSEHEAIDIIADQWTPVKAPADWYIVFIQPPNTEDYAYVALKHYDWYMTIYGHISDIFVDEFDYVHKWEVFAQTGWEFWTIWAWFLTTWPHLHFEIFKDKEYVDPFTVLDLSFIEFAKLNEKYKYKFYNDFKERKWYEFKNKTENSIVFKLEWKDEIERQQYLISKYAVWSFNNWQMWIDESLDWNIDPSFVMCIWLAETTLWKHMKTPYNIWNIWNTDSGATKTFPNAASWVYWMIKTLNNKYLSQYNEIRQLSRYWNKDDSKPIYASSPDNWHRNIIKCMSHLKWTYVPDNYKFRLIN
jgi:murein DD-endopeptidase MepM/ murein hydrolase activator NlpD